MSDRRTMTVGQNQLSRYPKVRLLPTARLIHPLTAFCSPSQNGIDRGARGWGLGSLQVMNDHLQCGWYRDPTW